VKPIYISKDDVLTDDTARQILILDEQWSAFVKRIPSSFQIGSLTYKVTRVTPKEMEKRAGLPLTGCSFRTLKRY
jgi:hypothetical protein